MRLFGTSSRSLTPPRQLIQLTSQQEYNLIMNVFLKQFLNQYPAGKYPLHEAVFSSEKLHAVLKIGYDLENRLPTGESPLHLAAQCGLEDSVRILLESGSEVEPKNREQNTPLHFAIYPILSPLELYEIAPEASFRTCRILVTNGADINAANKLGLTPLVLGIKTHNDAVVDFLLEKGTDLTVVDGNGWSSLHHACFVANPRYVELLLAKGAIPSVKAKNGQTLSDILDELDVDDFEEQISAIRQMLKS